MNNSFEQLNKHQRNLKNIIDSNDYIKKQAKANSQKYKYPSYNTNQTNNQPQSYYSSVISNSSLIRNNCKLNNSKSNQKKSKKDESSIHKNNKLSNVLKKYPTIQLTKKQKQIREAIQYRYEKSKLKNYKLSHSISSKSSPYEDSQIRQIFDLEQQQKFAQIFSSLMQLKTVNLYQYHQNKNTLFNIKPPKQKSNGKIIVIKNNKKKRQNSQSLIQLNYGENQMKINSKYFADNNPGYFSNKNNLYLKSQRNHLQSAHSYSRNKSQFSSEKGFKLQFLKNYKPFSKQKSNSRSKILKTEYNNYESQTGIKDKKQKINISSSVQKNFKSIKDIYLNALSNLANKNTVKTNKLMKNNMDGKNKGSKGFLQGSEKKQSKKDLCSSLYYEKQRVTSNQHSSSLIQPPNNYFSCISSRQPNFKQSNKNNSFYKKINCKETKQKLQKTLLISDANPAQWKSIILKIGDQESENYSQQQKKQLNKKNLKIKTKQEGFSVNFSKNNKKEMMHPHSHRQYTKSPKYKRFIIAEEQQFNSSRPQNLNHKKYEGVKSIKNLDIASNQRSINVSHSSVCKDSKGFNKKTKK